MAFKKCQFFKGFSQGSCRLLTLTISIVGKLETIVDNRISRHVDKDYIFGGKKSRSFHMVPPRKFMGALHRVNKYIQLA